MALRSSLGLVIFCCLLVASAASAAYDHEISSTVQTTGPGPSSGLTRTVRDGDAGGPWGPREFTEKISDPDDVGASTLNKKKCPKGKSVCSWKSRTR
ncbi:hypothetical protein [Acuticoccus sediminis]|uniref:hypothetical protein n=1 Tax=Acuticoccus sediminis TaxID=2184697 RepID=UPI0011B93FFC|nr:hypothetical protein [Acuticoccus sediminis]